MNCVLTCSCGEILVKSINGTTKVRSKILKFNANGMGLAVCKGCGQEREVPVRLDTGSLLMKAQPTKLFVSEDKSLSRKTKGSKIP